MHTYLLMEVICVYLTSVALQPPARVMMDLCCHQVSYIKAIDVWVVSSLIFAFAALLEFAYVNVLARRADKEIVHAEVSLYIFSLLLMIYTYTYVYVYVYASYILCCYGKIIMKHMLRNHNNNNNNNNGHF